MRTNMDRLAPKENATYRCDVSSRYIGQICGGRTTGWIVAQSSPGKPPAVRAHSKQEVRARMSSQRSGVLELAVLGLLHETPMHGYELRKRLNSVLGAFRAFGYGSLYPCLKDLTGRGLIAEETVPDPAKPLAGRRSKIVYRLTADGKEYLHDLLTQTGPAS